MSVRRALPAAPRKIDAARLAQPSVWVPLAVLGVMLVQAGASIVEEWHIRALEGAATRQIDDGRHAGVFELPEVFAQDESRGPRVAALRALMRARAASSLPPGEPRAAALSRAQADADAAAAGRPMAGFSWITKAYVHLLADGPTSAAARDALARSYAASGYLRASADWRLRYAATHWTSLDAQTRRAAANEGRWLSLLSPGLRVHVYVLTGGTPLYKAISGRTTLSPARARRPR